MANVNWNAVNAEINKVRTQLEPLNVNVEKCGNWIWVSGNTKQYSQKLRNLGCKFSAEKKMWVFVPPSLPVKAPPEKPSTIEEIRRRHGSESFKKAQASNKGRSSGDSSTEQRSLRYHLWEAISKTFMLLTVVYD